MLKNKSLLLVLAFVLELLLIFFSRNQAGFVVSPLLLVAAGCFLSFSAMRFDPKEQLSELKADSQTLKPVHLTFVVLTLGFLFWTDHIFQTTPINIKESDIVPLIRQIYIERWMNGTAVYEKFTGFTYGTFTPNYLPLHWFPFYLTTLAGIDIRWASVWVMLIALVLYQVTFVKDSSSFKTA